MERRGPTAVRNYRARIALTVGGAATALVITAAMSAPAQAAPVYHATNLGDGVPVAINNAGDVVIGTFSIPETDGYLRHADGTAAALQKPAGYQNLLVTSLSNAGVSVGSVSNVGPDQPARWDKQGHLTLLPTAAANSADDNVNVVARGINNQNTIVGTVEHSVVAGHTPASTAVVWSANGLKPLQSFGR
ncbi:MAG: hypothetical protein JWM76_4137, partial [Pseudonocardiales bacterium]|nr:hypothetical protein [Pseudonocardiales bacterium]